MVDKPTIDDLQQQLQNAESPKNQEADYSPARRIVENALLEVEADNSKKAAVCNDMFVASVKKIREQSEPEFLAIKARYGAIKGLLATDLNKLSKIAKKPRSEGADSGGRESKVDVLITLIKKDSELFHGEDDECFCSYKVEHEPDAQGNSTGEHWETWNLRSKRFKQWANHRFYLVYGSTVGDSALSEAIETLIGGALYDGEEKKVNLRYASLDGFIYVDLGCEDWKTVAINAQGWKVLESVDCPVKFYRSENCRPLPLPELGGDVSLLWEHLNLQDKDKQLLTLAWLLEAMRPDRPYPVIEIGGQQGTAKSTFSRRLRRLIDPNQVDLRAAPRGVEDIFTSTQSNHVICYENLSHLSKNFQNAFCVISTGGGYATRKLYSTSDEEAFSAMRPTILNGIGEIVTRSDLADRTIYIELSKIDTYIPEAQLEQLWSEDYPKITGALYSLLSRALAELPSVEMNKPPRMADYAKLGQAMLQAMGNDQSFKAMYLQNRTDVITRAIEASPVALAILDFIEDANNLHKFYGTHKQLLIELDNYKPKFYESSAWPKSPKALGTKVQEIAPALLVRGVLVEKDKKPKNNGIHVSLSRVKLESSTRTTVEL